MGEHLTNTYSSPLDGGRTHNLGCSLGCPLTVADQILLCNIWSYPHCSKCTPLPPSALSLFRPWLPSAGM